jgi:hypothetical protein
MTILREEKLRKISIEKIIFDSFRLNKEQEKYIKVHASLNNIEKPKI